jgi:hypothetical protein
MVKRRGRVVVDTNPAPQEEPTCKAKPTATAAPVGEMRPEPPPYDRNDINTWPDHELPRWLR